MKFKYKIFLFIFLLPVWTQAQVKNNSFYSPVNGWIILSNDSSTVLNSIKQAAKYNVNHIQLSHDLIMNIDDLLKATPESAAKIRLINRSIKLAHQFGIKVYIWCHEFSVPDKTEKEICYSPESPIWSKRKDAYQKGINLIPEIDGIILMYGSSPIPPWKTTCNCDWCKAHGVSETFRHPADIAKRITIITREIGGFITNKLHKELFIRTFVHEPEEINWYNDGLSAVKDVPFSLMHKSAVQDWQPYNPHNACLGEIPNRKFVVENDAVGEYLGKSLLPYCSPGYYLYRLHYMKQKGGTGTVTRIGIHNIVVLGKPNFINLYAISLFNHDNNVTLDRIWEQGLGELYGKNLSVATLATLRQVLEKTAFIRMKSHFVLGVWAYDQSSDYPKSLNLSQFYNRGDLPKWDSAWKDVWTNLNKPDITTIKNIWQESTEAVEQAKYCSEMLPVLKGVLEDSIYNQFDQWFAHQYLAAKTWRAIDIYTFSRKALAQNKTENKSKDEFESWKYWARSEMQNLLNVYKKQVFPSLPLMGYQSLQRYVNNIKEVEGETIKTGFTPDEPLFSGIEIHVKENQEAVVKFNVKKNSRVKILYGEKLPFPENTIEMEAYPDKNNEIILSSLQADKRYVVRITTKVGNQWLYSADHWFYTF